MINTITLSPGVFLRCYQDHRFKQGRLSLQIIRPMDRAEASKNALLPAVLLRGTRQYPDLRAITLHLDDLYGAAVGTLVRRVGDYQTTGLACGFIEDRFAMEQDQILAPMVSFLEQLLLDPVLEDGVFSREFVSGEQKNLISAIDSQRNDKRAYAAEQMMQLMCPEDSFGIPRLGTREDVAAIDAFSLYEHYRHILRTSRIDLFYVGSRSAEEIADLLRPVIAKLSRDYQQLPAQTAFHESPPQEKTEVLDVAQGKLCMGFVTDITLRDPRFVAMQMANTIFGGCMTNKLFMVIREKLSLCYDIGASYHGSKGIVHVSAGIDCNMDATVRQEVLRQLEACCQGDISEEELESARQALLSQLRLTHDSPGSIEGYYATGALSGMTMTPEQYMEKVTSVTKEQVVEAARTLRLHTVYFLKGESA